MSRGFQPPKHDFNPATTIVAALVVLDGLLALFLAGDACAYPFVFQRFSEPTYVIFTSTKQPIYFWQAAEKRLCTDMVTKLVQRLRTGAEGVLGCRRSREAWN